MRDQVKVCFSIGQVAARLADLGLTPEPFAAAAKRSFNAFSECTENHPLNYGGLKAWGEGNAALREELLALGWERSNDRVVPLVISPSGTMAITLLSGDESTGKADQMPSTKTPKGPRTRAAVGENRQFALFEDLGRAVKEGARATWIFLVCRDLGCSELRSELSLPHSIDDDGHIDYWRERIIFEAIPLELGVGELALGDGEVSPEIALDLKRIR